MKLPVFPLPTFLLPHGVSRLRIFEPRYIRMVSEATQNNIGFVLSTYQPHLPFQTSPWGSWVEIIDFSTLPDGLLAIDVKSKGLVKLQNIEQDEQLLRYGDIKTLEHWEQSSMNSQVQFLAQQLAKIFDDNKEYASLYKTHELSCPNWVCARLLEMLPLDYEQKSQFSEKNSFDQASEFLFTLFTGKSDH